MAELKSRRLCGRLRLPSSGFPSGLTLGGAPDGSLQKDTASEGVSDNKIKVKLKGPIYGASNCWCLRIFEAYLVHSLTSAPNADKSSAKSGSFSSMSWIPFINATYSGPRVF